MPLRELSSLRLAQTVGFVALSFLVIITGISFVDYAETYVSFGVHANDIAEDLSVQRDTATVKFAKTFRYTITFYITTLVFTFFAAIALAVEMRLLLYFTGMIAFALAINTAVIFSFPASAKSSIDKLTHTIFDMGVRNYFSSIYDRNTTLLRSFVDDFQITYSCCGLNDPKDYESSMGSARPPKYLPCIEENGKKLGLASVPLTCCTKEEIDYGRQQLNFRCAIGPARPAKSGDSCRRRERGVNFDHEPCKKVIPLSNSSITRYSAIMLIAAVIMFHLGVIFMMLAAHAETPERWKPDHPRNVELLSFASTWKTAAR